MSVTGEEGPDGFEYYEWQPGEAGKGQTYVPPFQSSSRVLRADLSRSFQAPQLFSCRLMGDATTDLRACRAAWITRLEPALATGATAAPPGGENSGCMPLKRQHGPNTVLKTASVSAVTQSLCGNDGHSA